MKHSQWIKLFLMGFIFGSCPVNKGNPIAEKYDPKTIRVYEEEDTVDIYQSICSERGGRTEDTLFSLIKPTKLVTNTHILPEPFGSLDFDRVVAIDYDGHNYLNIVRNKVKIGNGCCYGQRNLTAPQIARVCRTLVNPESYCGFCLCDTDPNLALVFCKGAKVVAFIRLSLRGGFMESTVDITVSHDLGDKRSEGTFRSMGFSPKAMAVLTNLCHELHFNNCR